MTDKSDKIVVTIEWEGGSYTGEVCDGIPARPTKYQALTRVLKFPLSQSIGIVPIR